MNTDKKIGLVAGMLTALIIFGLIILLEWLFFPSVMFRAVYAASLTFTIVCHTYRLWKDCGPWESPNESKS